MSNWSVIIIVLAMLGLERIVVTKTTKSPKCQQWYHKFWPISPNGLSVLRLPMGIISILMADQGWWTAAALWFSFWMITDMSDGTIARNCNMVTEMGKWLDPLSDKFMYFPPLLYFSSGHICDWGLTILPLWLVIPFIVFDIVGQTARLWIKKVAANSFGKGKTALVTVLLATLSLNQIEPIVWNDFLIINQKFVFLLMLFSTLLAFMSFYCKVIPDRWYANTLILLNYLCGITSVCLSAHAYLTDTQGFYVLAFLLVFLGQFFDLFDGRLAQKFGSTLNADVFDEIADAANYGIAISMLLFCCLSFCEELVPWQAAAAIVSLYWGATMFNLFRYRHSAFEPTPGQFCGLPASAGAALSGSTVLLGIEFSQPFTGIVTAVAVIIASFLMISKIPYRHFGLTTWKTLPRMLKLLICILILIFLCLALAHARLRVAFTLTAVILSILYAFLGAGKMHMHKTHEHP